MPRVTAEHMAGQRDRIIAAASALFADRGFARTTMAEIVRESALSMGTVYHYFDSKEALVLAVVEGRDGPVGGQFPDEDWREMLTRLGSYAGPDQAARHPRLVAQVWGEAAVSPALAVVVRESHSVLRQRLESLMNNDRRLVETGQSAELSEGALAALIGLSALIAAGFEIDEPKFTSTLVDALERRASENQNRAE